MAVNLQLSTAACLTFNGDTMAQVRGRIDTIPQVRSRIVDRRKRDAEADNKVTLAIYLVRLSENLCKWTKDNYMMVFIFLSET
jgi:hypothetical protein